MARNLFVSHAHSDNLLCDRYVEALGAYPLKIWYDRSSLHAGRNLSSVIQQELQNSSALILMLTPSSLNSYWVQLELAAFRTLVANDPARMILPVRIAMVDIPLLLQPLKYVDAVHLSFENAIREIALGLGLQSVSPDQSVHTQRKSIFAHKLEMTYTGHALPATKLAWSPDSESIVSVSRDNFVHVWDPKTGQTLIRYQNHFGGAVNAASWSPDGSRIVSGDSSGIVNIWEASTGRTRVVMKSHVGDPVNDVAWSPDNLSVAIARSSNIVQIYDSQTGNIDFTFSQHTRGKGVLNGVLKVSWSPDGMLIASSGWDNKVRVWDMSTGIILCNFSGHGDFTANSIAWSPEGTRIASVGSDGTLQIWEARTGNTLNIFQVHPNRYEACVCWSPDALYLASVGFDPYIRVWNVFNDTLIRTQTSEIKTQTSDWQALFAISWSPDGKYLAVSKADTQIQIWTAMS